MDKKSSLIIENHYFPCVNWFKISNNYSYIELLSNERWEKMSFRNRCVIAGANGLINLSAPIANGRSQKLLFKDIKPDYSVNWQMQHWKTIVSCYNRSPFFEYYSDVLVRFFEKKYEFLFDMNMEIIICLSKYLFDNKKIIKIELNDFNEYQSPLEYCNPRNFQQIPNPVKYLQLFEDRIGFQPNLSVLDLLFMEGPNAKKILNNLI